MYRTEHLSNSAFWKANITDIKKIEMVALVEDTYTLEWLLWQNLKHKSSGASWVL